MCHVTLGGAQFITLLDQLQSSLARTILASMYESEQLQNIKWFDLHFSKYVQLIPNVLDFMVGLGRFEENYGYVAHSHLLEFTVWVITLQFLAIQEIIDACQVSFSRQKLLT